MVSAVSTENYTWVSAVFNSKAYLDVSCFIVLRPRQPGPAASCSRLDHGEKDHGDHHRLHLHPGCHLQQNLINIEQKQQNIKGNKTNWTVVDVWHEKALNKHTENVECHCCLNKIKGSLRRDFQLQFFSLISFSPSPQSHWITKIRGNIRSFVFIAGVVDTGDKLFPGLKIFSFVVLSQNFPVSNFFPFVAGVVDTSDHPLLSNISTNFRKNLKWPQWDTQGPRGN